MIKNRHKDLGLTDDMVMKMYETMLMARRIDERMWLLNRAGKIPFVISCQGQEAARLPGRGVPVMKGHMERKS